MFGTSEAQEMELDYTSLPEPDHLETAMDGLMDTVTGNEALTYSQRYLHSCLQTSGMVDHRSGLEGFFSAIGTGIKAAYDYVMKMFKAIWNFFFGGGDGTDEADEKKVEDQVEKDREKIDTLAVDPKDKTKVRAAAGRLKVKAKRIAEDPKSSPSEKKTAEETVEKLNKWEEEADWSPELKTIAEEALKFDRSDRSHLVSAIDHLKDVGQKMLMSTQTTGTEVQNSSEAMSLHRKMLEEIKVANTHLNEVCKRIIKGVHSLFEARELQTSLSDALKKKIVLTGIIKKHKNDIQKQVNTLTAEVNKAGNEDNGKLHDDLGGCKALMVMVNRVAQLNNAFHDAIRAVSKANAALIA